MIYYISIGNSDDKLSQMQWGKFYRKVDLLIQGYRQSGIQVHGRWVSQSTDYWQNACWCIDTGQITATIEGSLKAQLRDLAGQFGQDSIAWALAFETEFLSPPKAE